MQVCSSIFPGGSVYVYLSSLLTIFMKRSNSILLQPTMSKVLLFSLVAIVIAALSHPNTNNSQDNIDEVICGSEIETGGQAKAANGESCVADIGVAAAESSIDTNLIEKDSNNGPKTKERKERQETSVNAQNTPKQMRVIFKNRSKKPVKLWWKGFDGEKVLQAEFRNSPEETVKLHYITFHYISVIARV